MHESYGRKGGIFRFPFRNSKKLMRNENGGNFVEVGGRRGVNEGDRKEETYSSKLEGVLG